MGDYSNPQEPIVNVDQPAVDIPSKKLDYNSFYVTSAVAKNYYDVRPASGVASMNPSATSAVKGIFMLPPGNVYDLYNSELVTVLNGPATAPTTAPFLMNDRPHISIFRVLSTNGVELANIQYFSAYWNGIVYPLCSLGDAESTPSVSAITANGGTYIMNDVNFMGVTNKPIAAGALTGDVYGGVNGRFYDVAGAVAATSVAEVGDPHCRAKMQIVTGKHP